MEPLYKGHLGTSIPYREVSSSWGLNRHQKVYIGKSLSGQKKLSFINIVFIFVLCPFNNMKCPLSEVPL